jgi:magnesium-transporting ATPase (P-type)
VLERDAATEQLGVDAERGLTSGEAAERVSRYGPNRFAEAKAESRLHAFLRQYQDPMQVVLLVAGLISIYPVKQPGTGIVILLLTLLNAVLGLNQEGKAAAAVAALAKMMIVKARVRRDGALTLLPAEQLVPGDVVEIEAGDVIPADGRVLAAATLEVAEAALTGESLPVSKGVAAVAAPDAPLGDRSDMVYMNTNVTRGTGVYVVTSTGMATEVGHISGMLQRQDESKSPLTVQLEKLTKQLVTIAGLALVASVVINMARGQSFTDVFTVAVAFAIAAIPTGLPAVVTTILSRGTRLLADANAIIKRLRSTETLGATSAICSDKTGTLTLNQMTAVELTLPGRRYTVSGTGYSTEGQIKRIAGEPDTPLEPFMFPLALACDAVVTDAGEMIGDPTEGALVVLAEKGGVGVVPTRERYPRVAELPFDTAYKLMATFHRMRDESGTEVVRCFVKGAPDQLLARAGSHLDPGLATAAADDDFRTRYLGENERLAKKGLRVMATARKDFDAAAFDPDADLLKLMDDLTLLALVGIVDPPRPAAKAAIATAHSAGIQVRMITGDHAITAAAIAQELGITGRAISGGGVRRAERGRGRSADRRDRRHRARHARAEGPSGRHPQAQGPRGGDDRRRRQRRAGAQAGGHRHRDGHHRHRGLEGGRGDDPHRRQLRDDRQGRRAGPRALRQPRQVHPVPDGRAGGHDHHVPRREHPQHRQRRSVPAAADAVGQLHDAGVPVGRAGLRNARRGLMERRPRKPEKPILTRADTRRFVVAGLVMGIATLAVIAGAEHEEGEQLARTMGMTTFAIANLFFSFTARDELRSVFSLDTFNDRTFLTTSLMSVAAIIFVTELQFFERVFKTVELTGNQWLICIGAAASIIVASEIYKFVLRRRQPTTGGS